MSGDVTELWFVYWCPGCGKVWADDEPPICRHGMHPTDPGTLAHPPRRMESLPSWHPFAESAP